VPSNSEQPLGHLLFAELALLRNASAAELCRALGISQSTFSRLAKQLGPRLLTVGRARSTRYAARRAIVDLGDRLPIHEVDPQARAERVAILPGSSYLVV
jgi:hypothetical protein